MVFKPYKNFTKPKSKKVQIKNKRNRKKQATFSTLQLLILGIKRIFLPVSKVQQYL